jgi:ABC-type transport system substrate-binding protein
VGLAGWARPFYLLSFIASDESVSPSVRALAWRLSLLSLPTWLLLPACGGARQPDPSRSRTLTLAVAGRMKGYALSRTRSYYDAVFATIAFEGLTRLDSSGTPRPSLATRWDVSPDGRTYRFTLRRNVRFHDGTAFGPADVARAWETALRAPRKTILYPWMLEDIEGADALAPGSTTSLRGVRVVDDSTVDVTLTRRIGQFPRLLAKTQAFIGAAGSTDVRPVGTGPWRWVSGAATGDVITLARNDRYWGARARMDSLRIRVIPDDQLVGAFRSGSVDCTADMTRQSRTELAARSDIRLIHTGPMGLVRIVLNLRTPALRNPDVRRALALALDRPRLAREVAAGPVIVANGALPPGVLGADPERPGQPYDPEAARRLLAASTVPLTDSLGIELPNDEVPEFSADFGTLLQSYWSAVGIHVYRRHSGNPMADMDVRISYPEVADPDDYLYSRFHSKMAFMAGNEGGFGDSLVDRWLDEGRMESDTAARARLMRLVNARIDSLVPNLFLWYAPVVTASSLRLNGCVAGLTTSTFVDTDLSGGVAAVTTP